MQITLKTLQQQTFRIDIDPEETWRGEFSFWRCLQQPCTWQLGSKPVENSGTVCRLL